MRKKNPTIKDIAKLSNTSITTVSFVLNGRHDKVSKETIENVQKIIKEIGYVPSINASSLKSGLTKSIGLIIPDIENEYYSRISKRLSNELDKLGYSLLILNSNDNFKKELIAIDSLVKRNIDYLIIAPSIEALKEENQNKFKEILENLPFEYLIIDRKVNFNNHISILNDDYYGAKLATEYLLSKGYKNIACITGPNDVSSSKERLRGYKDALKEEGVSFNKNYIFEGDYYFYSGKISALKIFENKNIDAIFAFNDLMAYGVYESALKNNIKIGQDIALMGYDDNSFSSLIYPCLTSTRPNINKMCEKIIEVIFDKKPILDSEIKIKTKFIVRESVGSKL